MAVQPFFWPQFQFFLGRNSGQLGQFHDLRWKHPRFWEFWGDYICGIFKGIFDGILILIHVYIYILLLLLLLIGSLMVSLMGYLILVLIHLCTYIYIYIYTYVINRISTTEYYWDHGMTSPTIWYFWNDWNFNHQSWRSTGCSTWSKKMLVILATNFSISVTEEV